MEKEAKLEYIVIEFFEAAGKEYDEYLSKEKGKRFYSISKLNETLLKAKELYPKEESGYSKIYLDNFIRYNDKLYKFHYGRIDIDNTAINIELPENYAEQVEQAFEESINSDKDYVKATIREIDIPKDNIEESIEKTEDVEQEILNKDNISTLKPGDVLIDSSHVWVVSNIWKEGFEFRPSYKVTIRDIEDGRAVFGVNGTSLYGMKLERAENTKREINPNYITGKANKVVTEDVDDFENRAKDIANKLGVGITFKGYDKFELDTTDKNKVQEFYKELFNIDVSDLKGLKEDMLPREDFIETHQKEIENVGQTNYFYEIVNNLIKDEIEAITGYDNAITAFMNLGITDYIKVLEDISKEEKTHIGQLETILNKMKGDTIKNIDDGREEAEKQIEKEETEKENVNNKDVENN